MDEIKEEIFSEDRRYVFSNGVCIEDEDLSDRMRMVVAADPAKHKMDSTGYSWDEAGLADLFIEVYQDNTRYCPERKSWFSYKDGVWRKDVGGLIVSNRIKDFCKLLDLYCWDMEEQDIKERYKKFLIKTGDRRFRDRIMKDAMDNKCITAAEFDADPYLINCKNGTFDLKTMKFRGHDWRDYLTMQTNFYYQNASEVPEEYPRWDQFIDEIMEHSEIKKNYLQKALGYSLLGLANEECMFILYGKTTRNGKSTLLGTIEYMLGDYSSVAPVGIICKANNNKNIDSASPTIASLKGKRFVTMAESDEYGKLDEEIIKQLTGGEAISARNLYESMFTFIPQFTLWLSCNDLPAVSDKSLFASDRLRVIEFTKHFGLDERDKNLKEQFKQRDHMKAIFRWLLEGYQKYLKEGLEMPAEIKAVVKRYERDNDLVVQFLEDKCEVTDGVYTKKKDLYDAYKMWCKSNGYFVCSARKFNSNFLPHVEWYEKEVIYHGYPSYRGITIKTA